MPSISKMQRCIPQLTAAAQASGLALSSKELAEYLDTNDVLAPLRSAFHIPGSADGEIYFSAHALGPMPRSTPSFVEAELRSWQETGAPGHSKLKDPKAKPWTAGHPSGGVDERYTSTMAKIIGARTEEVCWMGTLTANLHSLMSTFYKPEGKRVKILYEENAFPSDRFAFHSHVGLAGLDPSEVLIGMNPREGEHYIRTEDVLEVIKKEGESIALVLFGAVSWYTGQWYDMATITKAGKEAGCIVGWDCAHAVGNVPMSLHDWDVDFAVWCTYKYLNSGPGATAGIFVNEKHFDRPRPSGWWGHDLNSRFCYAPAFKPRRGAAGFAVSNPTVIGTVPVHASMEVFEKAFALNPSGQGALEQLRQKSILLTGYLEYLLTSPVANAKLQITMLSPEDPDARGGTLGFLVEDPSDPNPDPSTYSKALKAFCGHLESRGVFGDKRAPSLLRLAPAPMYNTFEEAYRLGEIVKEALSAC